MDFKTLLSEEEKQWISELLKEKEYDFNWIPSPTYIHIKKTESERNMHRHKTREILDRLRSELPAYTPQQIRDMQRSVDKPVDFPGIYVIYNSSENMYYIGQSRTVFSRSYKHFIKNKGNPEVYKDYTAGHKFLISLIPLESTTFTTLNELEDNAIRAYDSYENGYNLILGNINDLPIFYNKDHETVANFFINKIKGFDVFLTLTNNKKRMRFIREMVKEIGLPYNDVFHVSFMRLIKVVQKEVKEMN